MRYITYDKRAQDRREDAARTARPVHLAYDRTAAEQAQAELDAFRAFNARMGVAGK